MPLTAGDKLGPYEIVEAIGKGGMGEVYRARDTRLGRDVAVKISAEKLSERFEREARAIASLNHPNICTLHDVGPNYLVMELVEGPTLAERIKEGAIPLEESLPIARQIADALEAAHEKGIVHRDLKPGNVKIKPGGSVKVLDFGLAKVGQAPRPDTNAEESPTISMHATQAGVILGTAAYMAPEQARGKNVDKRADIWAFGVVLYEMVTGKKLFLGEDLTETLAAVVMKEPDLSAAPPGIRRLLAKCLEKDPRKRLRDIGDAWALLGAEPGAEPAAAPAAKRRWLWPAIAAALAVVAAVGYWAPWRGAPAPAEPIQFEVFPPAGTAIHKFAVSPDGRKIAYFTASGSTGGLWVRSLDNVTPVRIGGDMPAGSIPSFFWSADSRTVAFAGGLNFSTLMAADSEGGGAEVLAEPPGGPSNAFTVVGGSWSRDGTILFGALPAGVWRISAGGGGKPVRLTESDPAHPALSHNSPILLPDGKHFLYHVNGASPADSGVFVGSLDATPAEQSRERIVATNVVPGFVPGPDAKSGTLLFLRDSSLLAQTLDLDTFQLTGRPARIASGVGSELEFGGFSVSPTGVLAYRIAPSGEGNGLALRWLDQSGKPAQESVEGFLNQALPFQGVALSPDGSRAAVSRLYGNAFNEDLWLLDFARSGAVSRFTSGSADHWDYDPVWSPDGSQIAYVSNGKTGQGLVRKSSSGSGAEEVLLPPNGHDRRLNHWSRDGRFLLFSEQNPTTKSDLWVLPLEGDRKPEVFLNSAFNETQGQFSPDGRWIAYVSDETGQPQVYVQPFPPAAGGGEKIPVSNGRGLMPRWRRDGKALFFFQTGGGGETLMTVDFTSTPVARAGIPRALFLSAVVFSDPQTYLWDVAPSGDRFLVTGLREIENSGSPLTVVLNWQGMLEK